MPRAKGRHVFCIVSILMKLPDIMRYYFRFHVPFCFPKSEENCKFERPKTVFYGPAHNVFITSRKGTFHGTYNVNMRLKYVHQSPVLRFLAPLLCVICSNI